MRRSWNIIKIGVNMARVEHKSISIPCFELVSNNIKSWWKNRISRAVFYNVNGNVEKIISVVEFSKILFKFDSGVIVDNKFFREFIKFFFYVVSRVNNLFKWVFLMTIWTNYLLCFVSGFCTRRGFALSTEEFKINHSDFLFLNDNKFKGKK